ncbi:hypothetical protein DW322_19515 [Rhodococcus rhodnii]|uniref:Uncharacterized protein n=1 Tax=Rhodococcus rhodnii TaxID=38312 RepID=A0A6P2CJE1_9NOCA|nr:hypothetical protein DW322_19515 [Rhodococcus rhodnii]
MWWLVAALGILQGFAALAIVSGDRSSFVDTMLADPALAEAGVDVDRARMESLFGVGMGIVGLVIVAVTALFLVFVRSMARDRNWARMVLTMLGVLMVFTSIPVLFGLGGGALPGGADGMGLAMGAVQILQAVAAVGAIVLMHRKESNLYFLPGLSRKDEDR